LVLDQKARSVHLTDAGGLPRSFGWLERFKIAGCGRPDSEAQLNALKEKGIRAIVSLTGTPLDPEVVSRLGFEYLHSHMSGAPTIEQLQRVLRFVEERNAESKPVLVHCGEGIGRTGTVLAAYLISHDQEAAEAIRKVREERPGSIQTPEQEKILHEFERFVRHAHSRQAGRAATQSPR
jgi:atypical dual specificity phosphatase